MTYTLFSTNRPLISRMTLSNQYGSRMDMTYGLFQKNSTPLISQISLSIWLEDSSDLHTIFNKQAVD